MATVQEVEAASVDYFGGDKLAANIFATKYALADRKGDVKEMTPDDMHRRLAREFARIESMHSNPMSFDEIYNLFRDFKYVVPQGSPMSGIGNPYLYQSLSNCFVIESPFDSYGGILYADQEQIQIMKRRGGVGFDVSTIRPKGLPTSNAAKTTDGVGVFMERFSNSCREVAQGGRRGALMLSIDCRHPEIMTFINIKRDLKKVTGANISIRFTDAFMEAVEDDQQFILRWPVEASVEDAVVTEIVNAKTVWEAFIDSAWASAEPGALFWDRIVQEGIADIYADVGFRSISTNPCGEIPLSPYDSCRLMVMNLTSFVVGPFTSDAHFDFDLFHRLVMKAQRLMDDLVSLEVECIEKILEKIEKDDQPEQVKQNEKLLWRKIRAACLGGRRTGLGITGLGDTLAALGIKYGSIDSIAKTEEIYRGLAVGSHTSSLVLAQERGSFEVFDYEREKDHKYLQKVMDACEEWRLKSGGKGRSIYDMWRKTGRRNIANTTTAPVGSVSCETQTTSGLEPTYRISSIRRKKIVESDTAASVDFIDALGDRWQEYTVYHHWFKKWMDVTGLSDPALSPYHGATADSIDWEASVDIQAAAQRWVDHSISKTCNLPTDASKALVNDVYFKAWKTGCKGFTVYRDGCRDGVILDESKKKSFSKFVETQAVKRPKELPCDIHQVTIKGEQWTILVGLLDGKPYEVMAGLSEKIEIPKKYKSGMLVKRARKATASIYDLVVGENGDEFKIKDVVSAFENPNYSGHTRLVSLGLRHGAKVNYVSEQLQKGDKDADLFSFSKVITRALKKYIQDGDRPGGHKDCAECGAEDSLQYIEGCVTCRSCGASKC